MLSRGVQSVRLIPRVRQMLARKSHGHHHTENVPIYLKQANYNDFPVPRGSWQAKYDELQSQYNKLLIVSVVSFVAATWYWAQTADFVDCPPLESVQKLD